MKACKLILLLCLIKISIALDVKVNHDKQAHQWKISIGTESRIHFTEFPEITAKHGYKSERYNITTEDGYNLQIFRIPASHLSPKAEGKPVVLLEHGLGVSSNIWALFNRSLAYALADAGYDVWLGNCRGNYYGRSHKTISPEEERFWNFSFHEIGKLDYPATIDYILNLTKESTLSLVGHSMGGTAQIILLSERPQYNTKINVAVVLAPAVYLPNGTAVESLLKELYTMKDTIDPSGMTELMSTQSSSASLLEVCMMNLNISHLCYQALQIQASGQSDMSSLTPLLDQMAAGTSTKCVWHYCQLSISDQFRQYDYEQDNAQYYGESNPPNYNLHSIMTKMVIIYGETDPFCNEESALEIAKQVKEVILYKVDYFRFSHHDFFIARDLKTLLNNKIIDFIATYKE